MAGSAATSGGHRAARRRHSLRPGARRGPCPAHCRHLWTRPVSLSSHSHGASVTARPDSYPPRLFTAIQTRRDASTDSRPSPSHLRPFSRAETMDCRRWREEAVTKLRSDLACQRTSPASRRPAGPGGHLVLPPPPSPLGALRWPRSRQSAAPERTRLSLTGRTHRRRRPG